MTPPMMRLARPNGVMFAPSPVVAAVTGNVKVTDADGTLAPSV